MNYPSGHDYGLRLRGADEYLKFLNELKRECGSGSEFLKGIGDKAVSMIRKRTLQGKDVHGRPFKKYSKKYQARMKKSVVNLSTGNNELEGALGQIAHKPGPFRVVIYVKTDLYKSMYGKKNNAKIILEVNNYGLPTGRSKHSKRIFIPKRHRAVKREFWGLTEYEVRVLKKESWDNLVAFCSSYKVSFEN